MKECKKSTVQPRNVVQVYSVRVEIVGKMSTKVDLKSSKNLDMQLRL